MKKSLEISAKFSTADFDKSVDRMKQQLKDLYAPSDIMRMQGQTSQRLGMNSVAGGTEAQQRAVLRYRKELDGYISEEYKKQEALLKSLNARDSKLDRLKEKQKELVRWSDEELKIREKISKVEENQARKRQEFQQRDQALNAAINARSEQEVDIAQGYRAGGVSGATRAALARASQSPGSILGGVGLLASAAGNFYGDYNQSPLRAAAASGNAIQATAGQDSQNIYSRRSAFESAYNPERAKAAQMALDANSGARVQNLGNLAGNILGYAGAGAAGGSVIPGVGTALGGIGGAAYGAYKAFSDPSQRALALSPFSSRYNQEYESQMSQKLGGDYSSSLQDLRNQNPGKNLASQYYEQNYMGNLQSQRSMGMGNEQFYGMGGYLQSGANAGFTPEMMMGASAGILGAGGSTRSASGNSLFANQLSRNTDLTNSSQVLGTLSGGLGSSEATKQATIKILSEGMRLGLDDSKFAEENRRFTQAAAEIVARSGANSGSDFDRVSQGFGRFVGENSNAGIGAAKTAYEQYQQISSTTTGPRGVMRAAGFLSDDKLKNLSTIEKQSLMQIPESDLNANNPLIGGLADKLGISPEDFVGRITKINQNSVSRFKGADQARDTLRAGGVDMSRIGDTKYRQSLPQEQQSAITDLLSYQNTELGYQGSREMVARAAGTVGNTAGNAEGREASIESRILGTSGRAEDTTVSETAKDFGVVIQNFRDFKKEIIPSADAIASFTNRVREMMLVLRSANQSEIPGLVKYYATERAKNQVQTGKNSK